MLRLEARALVSFLSFLSMAAACGRVSETAPAPSADSDAGAFVDKMDGGGSPDAPGLVVNVTTVDGDDGEEVDENAPPRGRCASNADCNGGTCVALAPGGFRVCASARPPPQACTDAGTGFPMGDQCCGTCPGGGACTLTTACGGPFINPYNVCVEDECTGNADCGTGGVCLPIGVGSAQRRTCLKSNPCVDDGDCPNGGACALIGTVGPATQCGPFMCNATEPANGMRCIGASECSRDEDCPKGHCEPVGSRLECRPGTRGICPPPP